VIQNRLTEKENETHGIFLVITGSEYALIAFSASLGPLILSPVKTATFGTTLSRTFEINAVEFKSLHGR